MKRHLLKLADVLDGLGLSSEANVVDYYISKISQEDDWSEFASDVVSDELAMKGDVSVSLPDGETVINVFKNPLGQKLRVYAETLAQLFHEDPSQRTGQISVKQIDDIVDTFKTLNNDLTPSQVPWSENGRLIYPQTVGQIVKSVGSFVYHNSPFQIDPELYIDALEDIEITYKDFYTEDYLGAQYDPTEYGRKVDEWRDDPKNQAAEREREQNTMQWALQQRQRAEQKKREQQLNRLREIDPQVFKDDTEALD
jgi:hypothetical protein